MTRREFLYSAGAAGCAFAGPYQRAAAAAMREFRIHELAKWIDWWPDMVTHEGPYWENGYFTIQDKPGYGIELNPDVVKAHLAPGETWWR